jgi:hypothetical protein
VGGLSVSYGRDLKDFDCGIPREWFGLKRDVVTHDCEASCNNSLR